MKLVQACISVRKELEGSFHHMWCSCKPVYVRERPDKAVLTTEWVL